MKRKGREVTVPTVSAVEPPQQKRLDKIRDYALVALDMAREIEFSLTFDNKPPEPAKDRSAAPLSFFERLRDLDETVELLHDTIIEIRQILRNI